MTFSQDELIALLSNSSYQIGEPSASSVPLLYLEPLKPIHGQLNQPLVVEINGYGFIPNMGISIPGIDVIDFEILNFFKCQVTINVSYGTFPIEFWFNNTRAESYSNINLTINPSFTVDWIDYRETNPSLIKSSVNNEPTNNLALAGLERNSDGLRSASGNSNLWVNFADILLPLNSVFTYESICFFSNGNNAIWTGLSSETVNWAIPLRSSLAINALENRSYSRCYYGENSYYVNQDIIKGVNWNLSIIHTMIEFDRGQVLTSVFGRSGLDYDWNDAGGGELIFTQDRTTSDLNTTYSPCVRFMAGNSTSYLVAQKVS